MKKEVVIFDLDDTLAPSKQPVDSEMAGLICDLLTDHKVAVISGASYAQFERQLIGSIKCDGDNLKNLYLLPTNGSTMYVYDDNWSCKFAKLLSKDDKEKIRNAFTEVYEKTDYKYPENPYGVVLEDRGAQMTFSALGQEAPLDEKRAWDPDREKRRKMKIVLDPLLSEDLEVSIGGTTSIDITQKGINKAFGIKELSKNLSIPEEKMLFIGDSLGEGGNDAPAKETGVETRAVRTVEDTKKFIREILKEK